MINILDKRTCDRNKGYKEDLCNNIVYSKRSSPNDELVWMFVSQTACGYRNKASSFPKYYFCSKECMDYFNTYNRCNRCYQDGKGVYVEELGYSLCDYRSDYNPICISQYQLEKRFKSDYDNQGFYKLDNELKDNLLQGCDELKKLIADNDNKISYSMLLDLYDLNATHDVRERESGEKIDKETFIQQCAIISKELV